MARRHGSIGRVSWFVVIACSCVCSGVPRVLGRLRRVSSAPSKRAPRHLGAISRTLPPRSVRFCIRGIREELGPLKNNRAALRVVERIRRRLRRFEAETMTRPELHAFIDEFQLQLNALHQPVHETWFQPEA